MLLIPKGGGDYYVIDLVEVVWKVVTVILSFCLATSIDLHVLLHGFWEGCGTGTTSLEYKLLQKFMSMR